MDNLFNWATVICICAFVCMIVEILAPNGSMDKILKFVLAVFILCCTIIPLKSLATGINEQLDSININKSAYDEFSNDIEKTGQNITEQGIVQVVKQLLNVQDVITDDVEIITHREDKNIVITEIVVTVDKKYKEEVYKIKSSLEKSLNLKTRIELN